MARVAVIGGGYGGVTVAKGLDPLADVILIEQKDQFVHHAAALRAAVESFRSTYLAGGKMLSGEVAAAEDDVPAEHTTEQIVLKRG